MSKDALEASPTPKKGHARKHSLLPSFLTSSPKEDQPTSPREASSTSKSGSGISSPEGSGIKASASKEASPSVPKRKGHARSASTAATIFGTVRDAISSTSGFIPGLEQSATSSEVEVTFVHDEPPPPSVLPEDESLTLAQRVRNKVINEIICTELTYARDLERILEVFMNPIREQKLLDTAQMNTVFGGLSILLGMSKQMAKDLEVQAKKNGCIGSCFQGVAPYLKIYSQYCSNQQAAMDMLNKQCAANSKLRSFLEEKQFSKQCGGQPLASYLSKPTQRLCKYPLLLRELLKHTPPGHADRAPVEEVAKQIDVVVKSVNEARRRIEQSQAIYSIQARLETNEHLLTPTRVFFKEASLRELVSGGDFAEVSFFIFNDLLMICKSSGKKLAVTATYSTAKLSCAQLDESATAASLRNSFEVSSVGVKRIFFTTTPELRAELLTELRRAITSETAPDELSAEGSVREDGSSHSHSSANTADTEGDSSIKSRTPPPIPPKPSRNRPAVSPSPAAKSESP